LITNLSATQLSRQLRERQISAQEVADAFLDRIDQIDGEYRAFLKIDPRGARRDAELAQIKLDDGSAGPLTGIPIALKDNLSTNGIETTCASKMLQGYVPPFDATVVDRCRTAGMIVLGKTNLDEFAMGTSTENSAFQKTLNPWDKERSPGGSSGGSAVAVAAEMAPLSLGSDTGGSIRQPAALCGIVGFKPTYGRVSRYGLVAFASSLDQIGPFARNVEDAALLLELISGHDSMDSTSLPEPPIKVDFSQSSGLRGKKIALPKQLFGNAASPEVLRVVDAAIDELTRVGVQFEEIDLPSVVYGVTTYYIIAPAEASSNLARFDGIRYGPRAEGATHIEMVEKSRANGFGHEVKTRIMIGTYALSAGYYDAYYLKAGQVRALMTQEFDQAFEKYDAILSPSSPMTAFKLGELSKDPMALKLLDYCTIPANMGGFPGISLNCGYDDGGLPVGLQLMGPRMGDERLLDLAWCVEQSLPEARQRPPIP
jgi:aspartyl-tRNA(Asn)/glutamyl-tRNA(Gln) amidotransferase subunit A